MNDENSLILSLIKESREGEQKVIPLFFIRTYRINMHSG